MNYITVIDWFLLILFAQNCNSFSPVPWLCSGALLNRLVQRWLCFGNSCAFFCNISRDKSTPKCSSFALPPLSSELPSSSSMIDKDSEWRNSYLFCLRICMQLFQRFSPSFLINSIRIAMLFARWWNTKRSWWSRRVIVECSSLSGCCDGFWSVRGEIKVSCSRGTWEKAELQSYKRGFLNCRAASVVWIKNLLEIKNFERAPPSVLLVLLSWLRFN